MKFYIAFGGQAFLCRDFVQCHAFWHEAWRRGFRDVRMFYRTEEKGERMKRIRASGEQIVGGEEAKRARTQTEHRDEQHDSALALAALERRGEALPPVSAERLLESWGRG